MYERIQICHKNIMNSYQNCYTTFYVVYIENDWYHIVSHTNNSLNTVISCNLFQTKRIDITKLNKTNIEKLYGECVSFIKKKLISDRIKKIKEDFNVTN